jgi:hypothetical protein
MTRLLVALGHESAPWQSLQGIQPTMAEHISDWRDFAATKQPVIIIAA